jgi:hypothetical protein
MGRWTRRIRFLGLAVLAALLASCGSRVDAQAPPPSDGPTQAGRSQPAPNPNPPVGLVSYDIPDEGSDFSDEIKKGWENGVAAKCKQSGYQRNCLKFSYVIRGGDSECRVAKLRPPPNTPVKVGTVITVEVECEPSSSTSVETGP